MPSSEQPANGDGREEELRDLRAELDAAAADAREKAAKAGLEQAAASHHGMADAYESVIGRIDERLYGGGD